MIAEGECIGGIRLVAAIGRPTLALGARSSRRSARAWCPSRDYGPLAFFGRHCIDPLGLVRDLSIGFSVFCASGLPGRLGTGLGCRGVFAAGQRSPNALLAHSQFQNGAELGSSIYTSGSALSLRVMIVLAYGDPYFLQKTAKRACE